MQTSCSFSQTFNSLTHDIMTNFNKFFFLGFTFRQFRSPLLLATQTYITKTKVQFYNYPIIVTKKILKFNFIISMF